MWRIASKEEEKWEGITIIKLFHKRIEKGKDLSGKRTDIAYYYRGRDVATITLLSRKSLGGDHNILYLNSRLLDNDVYKEVIDKIKRRHPSAVLSEYMGAF